MTPPKVISAIHEQLNPLVLELAKYNLKGSIIKMEFESATVTFEFK